MEELNIKPIFKSWYEKIRAQYFLYKPSNNEFLSKKYLLLYTGIIFLFILYIFIRPPSDFPVGNITTIHPGESLQEISINLKNDKIIRSVFVFRSAVIILGGEKKIIAGDYLLDRKESSLYLAFRLIRGSFHLQTIKITIPEGWNVYQIGNYLEKTLVHFNKVTFLEKATKVEGYLFPDTYFISPIVTEDAIIQMMRDNFTKKIATIRNEIILSGHSEKDIVTMASILEGEALPPDRGTVSGILWKRLLIDMPLQVDSTFLYINGKNTFELTKDDLKIDSPYNTYIHKGLPIGPINNPGIDALRAAVNPINTSYLYFLTSTKGITYYAETFSEHKLNILKYLK